VGVRFVADQQPLGAQGIHHRRRHVVRVAAGEEAEALKVVAELVDGSDGREVVLLA
jgi:hypothetical protein